MSGAQDDRTQFQLSAEIQKGNSGGPVMDEFGNIIGVVVAKLDALTTIKKYGDIPQNVNFAIKSEVAMRFLNKHNIGYSVATKSGTPLAATVIAERAGSLALRLECFAPRSNQRDSGSMIAAPPPPQSDNRIGPSGGGPPFPLFRCDGPSPPMIDIYGCQNWRQRR